MYYLYDTGLESHGGFVVYSAKALRSGGVSAVVLRCRRILQVSGMKASPPAESHLMIERCRARLQIGDFVWRLRGGGIPGEGVIRMGCSLDARAVTEIDVVV